jgi:anti-sigma factor RsiW
VTGTHGPIGEDDLQAFIDDRLSGARRDMVEAYLAEHPEVRDRVAADRAQQDNLRAQLAAKFAEPIPPRLRIANIRSTRRDAARRWLKTLAAAIAIFVIGAASGWEAGRLWSGSSGAIAVAHNATAAYRTFVVEVAHPVEVDASHEAHLLHWLSKRLGRPLVAPDLSKFGYRLMGGRLLPAGSHAAAQLMYDSPSGKRLTVYVQAEPGSETAFRFRHDAETSTFAWVDQGFGFAVTALASREQLLPIAEAIYRSLDGIDHTQPDRKGRS